MILTLTLNPTIDHIFIVESFRLGDIIRAEGETRTPSGKGIGSSLVIRELGGETVALGLNSGHAGRMLSAMLDEMGVRTHFLPAQGETRIATVLVDRQTGRQSTISSATLQAPSHLLPQLLAAFKQYSGQAWGIICSGSLPPGIAENSYAAILEYTRQLGLCTLLDTSGKFLQDGIKGLPHILKINEDELQYLDADLEVSVATAALTRKSLARISRLLGVWASEAIVVTLGGSGTIAVTPDGCYFAQPSSVPVTNTAGAGDALSGGMMLALSRGDTWKKSLAWGTAAAASVVMNVGTAICQRSQVEAILDQTTIQEIQIHD